MAHERADTGQATTEVAHEATLPADLAATAHGSFARTASASIAGDAAVANEMARGPLMKRVVLVLTVILVGAVVVMGGDPIAKTIHVCGLGIAVVTSLLYNALTAGDASKYRVPYTLLPALGGAAAVVSGLYYWGVFSPALVGLGMVVFFTGLIADLAGSLGAYLVLAIPHILIALAIIMGVADDPGLIAPELTVPVQVVILVLSHIIVAVGFVLARHLRGNTRRALEQLEVATRAIAERDALLLEVRNALGRATDAGGRGRLTGVVIAGYELGNLLGHGAMGEVYEAVHVDSGQPAALKLLHRHVLSSENIQRFMREASAIRALDAPNVVRVLATGDSDSEIPYIAMERLEGEHLGRRLERLGRLPLSDVCELVDQIAAGLAAAAAAGIVHRDIKPSNVFLHEGESGPTWKILDFGMSRLLDESVSLTMGAVVGTPAYMSPEQARGERPDARADQHALATIAYRAITGRMPFAGHDLISVLRKVIAQMPARPSALPGVPGEVDDVIAIGMAKDAGDRFDDVLQLAAALSGAVAGQRDAHIQSRARRLLTDHPWSTNGTVANASDPDVRPP